MEKINSGDRKAASASYRLVSDINMKGSKLQPIGISESLPFSGVFDGNGMTISNFTINGAGYDVAGFFGYTRNARVVNLSLDYILQRVSLQGEWPAKFQAGSLRTAECCSECLPAGVPAVLRARIPATSGTAMLAEK